ncbi:hypothetical protein B4U79_04984 [Dinothrombium tinctorium]|uniref:Uncharacterized protein n=1 Tax=Dinothrombium tinctorium TaxID=1965070 RepID=A0A3S4QXX4_9ACAR|nr:hypothetical protein B4U79_04984 [Dinothrombium tinctorium]
MALLTPTESSNTRTFSDFNGGLANLLIPVTHVIFDLDGTLIDTESCYKDAANAVTMRLMNKEFTWKNKSDLMKTNLRKNSALIVEKFGLPLSPQKFYNEVMSEFAKLIKNVPFMPGAEKIVKYFHRQRIPLALCTASANESFQVKISHFGDFFSPGKYFDVIVIAGNNSEIKRNKPAPDPYLFTMSKFANPPLKSENVLVFEDSVDGVNSAIAAGAQCVMVPDTRVDNENATSKATLVLKSLEQFDPKLFSLPSFSLGVNKSANIITVLLSMFISIALFKV